MASRLAALALNCTLSPSPAESRTQLTIDRVLEALRGHDGTPAVAATTPAANLARQLVADPYPAA
jgi:hypothetical protein